jgi:hypothetical protein
MPVPLHEEATELISVGERSKPAASPKRQHPKLGTGSAWVAWQATGNAATGAQFLHSVSSWMEGTAAQLLRQAWPAEADRLNAAQVQDRLRHYLTVVAHDEPTTYLDALSSARRSVIDELRGAAQSARKVDRSS